MAQPAGKSVIGRGLAHRLLSIVAILSAVGAGSKLAVDDARASAFFIREQSASASASAFAGATASAADLTHMFFNGAVLGRLEGNQMAGVTSAIFSQAKFEHGSASTVFGSPIAGGEGGRNGGGLSVIPALYGVWDAAESFEDLHGLRLGLAVNVPFGFETEYEDDWIGRYHGVHSRVRSFNLNPVVAYTPVSELTLALGLQVQYFDAKLTNAIDFGTLGLFNGVPGAQPAQQDGFAKTVGGDWGYGYTAGLLLEPLPGTRLGLSYRSAIHHELQGNARIRLDTAGIGSALGVPAGTSAVRAKVTTPEVMSFGLFQQLDPAWAVMADVTWTGWSRFRSLRIKFEDDLQPNDFTEEDWRDTWFFAAGCSYRPDELWTLRAGIAYDQSPARNRTRTPRTPINNGLMLGVGADYQPFADVGVAVGYTHTFIDSARLDLKAQSPGNGARGSLQGDSDNQVDMFAMQLIWRF